MHYSIPSAAQLQSAGARSIRRTLRRPGRHGAQFSAAADDFTYDRALADKFTVYAPPAESDITDQIFEHVAAPYLRGSFFTADDEFSVALEGDIVRSDLGNFHEWSPSATRVNAWDINAYGLSIVQGKLRRYASEDSEQLALGEVGQLIQLVRASRQLAYLTLASTAGNWGGNTAALAGNARFDAASPDHPLDTINLYKRTIKQNCGREPNLWIMSDEIHDTLETHPVLLAYMAQLSESAINGGRITLSGLEMLFGMRIVASGDTYKNNAGTTVRMWPRATSVLAYQEHIEPVPGSEMSTVPSQAPAVSGAGTMATSPRSALSLYYLEDVGPGVLIDQYEDSQSRHSPTRTDAYYVEAPMISRTACGYCLTTCLS